MYEEAKLGDPRPGDLWWLPASWWPAKGPLVTRPFFSEAEADSEPEVVGRRYTKVSDAFAEGRSETIVIRAKRVPCLIISPYRDLLDGRVLDFVVLRTKDFPGSHAAAEGIRKLARPHAFPLQASNSFGLEERWVDFTSQDSFPKGYLEQSKWQPICRMSANYFERLLKHYGDWITRDQAGKP